ncbi:MAG: SPASM domain-containing protein [Flavobacteriales bacterium]|nr:SPASM domain-containing protein [Flavobacteriales bacterium]
MALFSNDTRNLLRKLTVLRTWNGVAIGLSFHVSRWIGKPLLWGQPVSVAIEPTTACNLGCPECPSGLKKFTRDTGNLKKAAFEKLLANVHRKALYMTFYFQGEPFIHPDFLDLVRMASGRNLYTATSTNAHFLTDAKARETVESGLDRLIISVDGTTQEVYEQYRVHGDLDKVLEGARNVIKWKKALNSPTPHVIFQFLIVRPNEHQVEEIKQLGSEIGVDEVRFKTAQVYDYEHGNELIPTVDGYSRYRRKKDGTWEVKNQLINQCWRMWSSCVVTWDGLVVPCCFDKDATHRMGNAFVRPFAEIWRGSTYRQFREKLLKGRDQIDICRNCSEGTRVWVEE